MERTLFENVKKLISPERIEAHVRELAKYDRYTGTEQGEKAAEYIYNVLEQEGIQVRKYVYQAYTSLPVHAAVFCGEKEIRALASVYGGSAKGLLGTLYYDELGEIGTETWEEEEQRFRNMEGKIVLTIASGGGFVKRAAQSGALAVIQMQNSPEHQIHHTTLGAVWGTPIPSDTDEFSFLPFVSVNQEDGQYLKAHCGEKIRLEVKTECVIRKTTMPVAVIPGKSSNFLLVSGHYDSWYEGVTDNAVSDAIMLEYARVFHQLSVQLKRSLVIGWWSGHSDARYSGSTYFFDREWNWLKENCVGHVNLDLAGCKDAEQIRVRTAMTEGADFTAGLIRDYTGREAKACIPMIRGADQSFWGADLPLHIMLKYEIADEKRTFSCPSGGPWWHSDEDTLDKMDIDIAMRDAKFNGEIITSILQSECLPVNVPGFIDRMREELAEIEKKLPKGLELCGVDQKLEAVEKQVENLRAHPLFHTQASDPVIKAVVGGLARLTYSASSAYEQDRAEGGGMFPGLSLLCGKNERNTRPEQYLFLQNEFLRQQNRMIGELDQILDEIELQLYRWNA